MIFNITEQFNIFKQYIFLDMLNVNSLTNFHTREDKLSNQMRMKDV